MRNNSEKSESINFFYTRNAAAAEVAAAGKKGFDAF